jgi:WD40 repeat protein
MAESHKYKAFISYSRKDREAARRLQRELESYVLPKAVEVDGLDPRTSRRPLNPVFRDESDLVPGQDLPERIRRGLAQSESLLVVCSPDATQSEWVEKEIVDFTKLGKGRRILAVVVGGEPNATARGLAAANEALPRALRFHVDTDGTIGTKPADPLWIDRRESVADRQKMFLRIVGAVLGLQSLDDLILRERQAERRRRLVAQGIAAALAVLAVLASGAGWIAYQKQLEAEDQRDQVVQAQSRLLTQAAAERLKNDDVAGAQRIILEVLAQRGANRSDRAAAIGVFQEMRATDRQLAVLSGDGNAVDSAAWSPDGKRIVTASFDRTARIWDAVTGAQLAVLAGHGDVVDTAAWAPDGRRIVTASDDKTARIWDAATGAQVLQLSGHGDTVNSAAWSPDGRRIVTASDDKTARIWDAATGAQIAVVSGHGDRVESASFSPDGRRVVTASFDKTVRTWDSATGAQLAVLSGHGNVLSSATWSPDGRRIVAASDDKTARIWDASTGVEVVVLSGHGDAVGSAVYSPDGRRVVTASGDKTARIWDASTGTELAVLSGHRSVVYSAAWSPDGKRIVTASFDKTARIWDASTRAQLTVLSGHSAAVIDAAPSPDGRRIVTASLDKTARIWDAASGAQLVELSGHSDAVTAAVYAPDGRRIVTASADKTARIWDAATGAQLAVLSGHDAFVESAVFSPDGMRIVTASDDRTARIWDATTGAQLAALSGHGDVLFSAVYSPDGRRVVTASSDKSARIWDAATGAQVAILAHGDAVRSAVFSPDGRRIVTASADKTARIWNVATGTQLVVLAGHNDGVHSVAWSPDGGHIVTSSFDKTARIWDADTGAELAVLSGHADGVTSAVYSPDGRRIVTASRDETARIWDARIPAGLDGQIVWDEAAEFEALSDIERSEFGLPRDPRVRTWAIEASNCDRAAAAPDDPDRRAPGIVQDQIAADVANSACAQEKSGSTQTSRLVYQLGRALLAKHDVHGARREFEVAVSKNYDAARIDLANLLSQPSAGMLDPGRAVSLYEQAWRDGVPMAAFELGHLYEQGGPEKDSASRTAFHPDLAKAWFWYRKGADAGEPHALARFGAEDDSAATGARDAAKRDAILLDAFQCYAAAAERARDEDWPDDAWRNWRYRRATLARLLARDGMMQQVADVYREVRAKWNQRPPTLSERIKAWLRL